MNKKAEFSTEVLVRIIIGIIVVFSLASVLAIFMQAFTYDAPSVEKNDFLRIKGEIEALSVSSKNIVIPLFSKEAQYISLTEVSKSGSDKTIYLGYGPDSKHLTREKIVFDNNNPITGYRFVYDIDLTNKKKVELVIDEASHKISFRNP